MAGMALPIGGEVTIKWKGETYKLAPLKLKDFGTIEHELLKRKREKKLESISQFYGKIPDALFMQQVQAVRLECEQLTVSDGELQEWIDDDREGICFTLWLMLSMNYPGKFVLEEMLEVIYQQVDEEELAKLISARDQASGIDNQGNETGSPVVAQPDKAGL